MNNIKMLLLIIISFSSFINAQNEIPLIPDELSPDDEYGATAISDNYAVIGAHYSDIAGENAGAIYVYKRVGTDWVPDAVLTADDALPGDDLGRYVGIYQDRIIAGALFANIYGEQSGAAYIFKNENGTWIQEAKLIPSVGDAGDQFGRSVAIYDNYAVVASRFYDVDGIQDAGAIFVFHYYAGNWYEEDIATIDSPSYNDQLGNGGLSIWGDYFVTGSNGKYIDNVDRGAAFVFKRDGKDWNQVANIRPYGAYDNFGCSPIIYNNRIIVGAYKNNVPQFQTGAAYIFKKVTDSLWVQEQKLLPEDGSVSKYFGLRVSLSNNTAVCGAIGDFTNGYFSGAAYIFKLVGDQWMQTAKLFPSNPLADEQFGYYVAASENYVLVGAPWKRVNGVTTGAAYLYLNDDLPVTELDLSADFINDGVNLTWVTATELNNQGFEIEKSFDNVIFKKIGFVKGSGNSEQPKTYSYFDKAEIGKIVYYRLKQIDFDGSFTYSNIVEINTDLPTRFRLYQNYPNPFPKERGNKTSTTISFDIPDNASVKIDVYSITGELVKEIINSEYSAGKHSIEFSGDNLPTGIYFYSLTAKSNDGKVFRESKKMTLIK